MDKVYKGHFHSTLKKVIWPPKKFKLYAAGVKKCHFDNFQKGPGWPFPVSTPLRIPCWISKNLFVLRSYEFPAMLQGKIRKGPSFQGLIWSGKITVQCLLNQGLIFYERSRATTANFWLARPPQWGVAAFYSAKSR